MRRCALAVRRAVLPVAYGPSTLPLALDVPQPWRDTGVMAAVAIVFDGHRDSDRPVVCDARPRWPRLIVALTLLHAPGACVAHPSSGAIPLAHQTAVEVRMRRLGSYAKSQSVPRRRQSLATAGRPG